MTEDKIRGYLGTGIQELEQRLPSGRYAIAEKIQEGIDNLNPEQVNLARCHGIDLMALSALENITEGNEAKLFRRTILPVEMATLFFPDVSYVQLEKKIDENVVYENNRDGTFTTKSVRDVACLHLFAALNYVFCKAYGQNSPKVQQICQTWKLRLMKY